MNNSPPAPPLYCRALVIFSGGSGVWWLRWLRPGFRHCFAAVDDGTHWLTVDPLLHRLEVRASGLASAFDLAAEYRRMGLVVLEIAPPETALRAAPVGFFTCVETVKRLLGLRARWVLTPWQLYRFLARRHGTERAIAAGGRRLAKALRTKQENILDFRSPTL